MNQGIFLRAQSTDATEAVIDVVGVIGWDVGFQQLRAVLASIPAEVGRIVFDIYSPGGDVWDGNAIIHEIGQLKQETVARVRVAASMATLIAVACKRREMSANGRWLIHNPWTATEGDAEELEKRAKELRDAQNEAAAFYASRTGKTPDEMLALMDEERWLTPTESKDYGFIHEIIDPFSVAAFAPVREAITAAGKWPRALAEIPSNEEPMTEASNVPATPDVAEEPTPESGAPAPAAVVPDAELAAQFAIALNAEYERGFGDGVAAGRAEVVRESDARVIEIQTQARETCGAADAALAALKKDLAEAEARAAKHQSERDRALAEVKTVRESLAVAQDRVAKHLAGALTFTPAIETWEEALRSCGGEYVKAAEKFPELLKQYRAKHARKG